MEPLDGNLRIGRFTDLSGAYHSAASKVLLCEEYLRSNLTLHDFALNHNIPPTTMRRIMNQYQLDQATGISTFRDAGSGRPRRLDGTGYEIVEAYLIQKVHENKAPTKLDFKTQVLEQVGETSRRRNIETPDPEIGAKTLWRYKDEMDVAACHAQLTTHARLAAQADPRNSYSMGVMVAAFCPTLLDSMIFNWDATQYGISPDNEEVRLFKRGSLNGPLTAVSGGGTYFSVKHYHLHNACGTVAPPVFVIADDSMEKDAFTFEEMPQLSISTDVSGTAYLCRCKTRNCNAAFYRWYGRFLVTPFVNDVRNRRKCKLPDGTPMPAFVTCDGEQEQIKVFQEADMLEVFAHADIIFAKIAASCSSHHQSSDVAKTFKGVKTKLAGVNSTCYQSPAIQTAMREALKNCNYASAMKLKISDSIQKIIKAIKGVMTPEIVVKGYEMAGQYPVDFAKCMKQSSYQFTLAEWSTMVDAFQEAVLIFRATGTLTEADMDRLQIPSVNDEQANQRPKDQRMLHQQRAVIMNAADCIEKYKDHYVRKEQGVADRVAAREKKEIDRVASKALKEAQKAERDAFNDLTAPEKKVARKAKKDAKAALAATQEALPPHQEPLGAAAIEARREDLDIFEDEEINGSVDD